MEQIKPLIQQLRKLNLLAKTEFIMLYGSQSKGNETSLSDIDFCISLALPKKERQKARMQLSGRLPDRYDIQIAEDLPLYVQKEVLHGRLIYCKNKRRVIERAIQIINDYEDFKPVYEQCIARRKEEAET